MEINNHVLMGDVMVEALEDTQLQVKLKDIST